MTEGGCERDRVERRSGWVGCGIVAAKLSAQSILGQFWVHDSQMQTFLKYHFLP
jgi:hypothetical protein